MHFYRKQKEMLLVDPITKSCVNTSYQSATVSGSHLEVGVKKKIARAVAVHTIRIAFHGALKS